jgi:ribosomal-protein-alanine N-acetyltransferase
MIPELETERVQLSAISETHLEDLFTYASDEEVTRYVSWPTHTSKETTRAFIRSARERYETDDNYYDWALVHEPDGRMFGTIGLRVGEPFDGAAELGYVLARDFWGYGFATEVASEVVRYGFHELQLSELHAYVFTGNNASVRVLEKLGMSYEGTELYTRMQGSKEPREAAHYRLTRNSPAGATP